MARIYTKVGDKGETSLLGGQKVGKDDLRIECYGTIDELNSFLGSVRSELDALCKTRPEIADGFGRLSADLETIQHWLFDLGSLLAAINDDRKKFQLVDITETQVKWLETRIDGASAVLKPLKEFILPGGSEASSRLHLCRTVTRRAERKLVIMSADLPTQAVPFINRLSDYFFVMARLCNHYLGIADVIWKKQIP
jgi:cob(I)alamin adenosyltransferase